MTESTQVILSTAPEYDDARRVWNGMINRKPFAIVKCRDVRDVKEGLRMAREKDLPVAVRGGGHNVAGFATCDDGIVLDLGPMNRVELSEDRSEAWIGGGALWGDVDRATQEHGLIVPGGLISTTGVGGFTLGGGLSWTRNLWGLTCDSLIGAEVVLANGSVVETSEDRNPELLWGLRGGGGNFGVVTRLRFRTYPMGPDVYQLFAFYDGEGDAMGDTLRRFLDYCDRAPDEVSPIAATGVFPPGHEHFPPAIQGRAFVLLAAVYAGSPEDGAHVLAPLHDIADPVVDFSGVRPYVEAQTIFDEDYPAHELRYYWKSAQLENMTDEVIDVIVEQSHSQPSPLSTIDIWCNGGAMARIDEDSAAFAGRRIRFMVNPEANWLSPDDDEQNIAWVRETDQRLEPFSTGTRYFNFPGMMEEGSDDVERTFGAKYERLRSLKRLYDPENILRLNQNIRP